MWHKRLCAVLDIDDLTTLPRPFHATNVVAAAIAYLGSEEASHVNGADLRVDGGTHS